MSFLLVTCHHASAQASCHFFVDPFFGYTCELNDAVIVEENEVLVLNTDNHNVDRGDIDVTTLTTVNCSLAFVPNSLIRQFPAIRYLLLDNAGIQQLTPGAFAGANEVVIFHARFNSIPLIPAGLFADMPSVLIMDLSNNAITEIDDEAFAGLSDLLELDINFNQLSRISSTVFRDLTGLEDLNLRYNQISEIEDGAFSTLRSLIIFYLRNNLLTEIRAEMFGDEMASLVFFNLNENRLTSVPRLPSRAPNLHYIYLTGNQITEINAGDFTFSYENITNVELSENLLGVLDSAAFEVLTSLDILAVNFNRITAVDHEFFARVPSLYTFEFEYNYCANIRFNNIRSINQEEMIEQALDRCYYAFFEPVITQQCTYVEDQQLGYTCELSGVTFLSFRDKFTFTGTHLAGQSHDTVTGIRIVDSDFVRVPPSIFRLFPNLESFVLNNAGLQTLDVTTFEQCGDVRHVDLSSNRIRRLSMESFSNCYNVIEVNLDDNQITEIAPCTSFLYNVYQARRISMRRNICVDRVLESIYDESLMQNYEANFMRHLNRCFSFWYLFLDDAPPAPPMN